MVNDRLADEAQNTHPNKAGAFLDDLLLYDLGSTMSSIA
jgi:hypothetical protein